MQGQSGLPAKRTSAQTATNARFPPKSELELSAHYGHSYTTQRIHTSRPKSPMLHSPQVTGSHRKPTLTEARVALRSCAGTRGGARLGRPARWLQPIAAATTEASGVVGRPIKVDSCVPFIEQHPLGGLDIAMGKEPCQFSQAGPRRSAQRHSRPRACRRKGCSLPACADSVAARSARVIAVHRRKVHRSLP
jgi:hypothetical protein